MLAISGQLVALLAAGLFGRQISPINGTNRRHPEGPLLGHTRKGAGSPGGKGDDATGARLAVAASFG
jgi:hypothetical protein